MTECAFGKGDPTRTRIFTANEKKLICGDGGVDAWKRIPHAQAESQRSFAQ